MSDPPIIRRLGPADLLAMRSLNRLFGRVFADEETYGGAPPDDAWLSGLLGRAHVVVLVAEAAEGTVVGGLVAYEFDKFERARREIYIYDLAVDERHRRRGVATGLIERLSGIAAEREGWVIMVQADHGDAPAIALYESLGAREEVLHFDIALPRPAG